MGSSKVIDRLDRVVTREIAGETLLVPIRSDVSDMHHIFALNPVAAHIWNGLDGTTSVSQIVTSLCDTFEVGKEQAEQDVEAFLNELFEAGLVKEI